MARSGWKRGAVALGLAYALVLKGVLFAIVAGLAAQPPAGLVHVLCAPGSPGLPSVPATPSPTHESCAIGCQSIASDLPKPADVAPAGCPRVVATDVSPSGWTCLAHPCRLPYPLGARAPPSLI